MSNPWINTDHLNEYELAELAKEVMLADKYDWVGSHARPEQLEPEESYKTLLVLAGRGFGKTRMGTELLRKWATENPGGRYAIVALGHRELRDVNLEGVSGLLNCFPPDEIVGIKKGLGDVSIELKNGSIITGFTSGNADALRGRSFDAALVDEYAAYNPNTAGDIVTQLWLCLRESENPRMVITSTPKKVKHIVDLVKKAHKGEDGLILRVGKTRDNTALSDVAVSHLESIYAGTRVGRQELLGELLLDVEGALWNQELIDSLRLDDELPSMKHVYVGVDPSGSADGDQMGIVVAGITMDDAIAVIENRTTGGSPATRFTAVCMAAFENGASEIWVESAFSGDNARFGIVAQWKMLQNEGRIPESVQCPRVLASTIKGDKSARAMPVVSLAERHMDAIRKGEKGLLWHAKPTVDNQILTMEDELTGWEPDSKVSPNSMDAMVHAVRALMLKLKGEGGVSRVSKNRRLNRGWMP